MNTSIFYFFYNLSHKSVVLDQIFIFITDKLGPLVLGAAVVYLFYFFASHSQWKEKKLRSWIWECFVVFGSTGAAYLIAYFLKMIFHAPRPFVTYLDVLPLVSEGSYSSFPSAHATLFFALATALYMYNKKVGGTFFFFATIIALSRMVVGVHYPLDLIGGAVIGVVTAYLFYRIVNSIFSRKNL
jgi:undecaprenyl-diphosphatase